MSLLPRLFARLKVGPECWEVQGAANEKGYPLVKVERKSIKAHRLVWSLFCSEIPPGQCVLHHCDNRRCVRPSHLWLGTQADNLADMRRKGRAFPPPGTKANKALNTPNHP